MRLDPPLPTRTIDVPEARTADDPLPYRPDHREPIGGRNTTALISPVSAAIQAGLPIAVAGLLARLATRPEVPGWYATLAKPPATPPNWVFGPAWGLLYVLIGVATYRVLRIPRGNPDRNAAVQAFWVQVLLNGAWSWSFFAAQNPALGLANLALLDLALVWTFTRYWRADRTAGLMLVPYGLWIGFATYLNAGIWLLNR